MDGTPARILVEESSLQCDVCWDLEKEPQEVMAKCSISELLRQEMPLGSFPTYRITNRDDKVFQSLTVETTNSGLENTCRDDRCQPLHAHMDVDSNAIQECY